MAKYKALTGSAVKGLKADHPQMCYTVMLRYAGITLTSRLWYLAVTQIFCKLKLKFVGQTFKRHTHNYAFLLLYLDLETTTSMYKTARQKRSFQVKAFKSYNPERTERHRSRDVKVSRPHFWSRSRSHSSRSRSRSPEVPVSVSEWFGYETQPSQNV